MNELSFLMQTHGRGPAAKSGPGPSEVRGAAGRSPETERKELARACSEFEAIFIEQLFKTMRATVPETGLLRGGRAEEIYTGMLDQQIAAEMARGQGSIGLSPQMQSRLMPDKM